MGNTESRPDPRILQQRGLESEQTPIRTMMISPNDESKLKKLQPGETGVLVKKTNLLVTWDLKAGVVIPLEGGKYSFTVKVVSVENEGGNSKITFEKLSPQPEPNKK